MSKSRRIVLAFLLMMRMVTLILGADLPVVPVDGTQGSLKVSFSPGAYWFLLPQGAVYYLGSPWGGGTQKSLVSESVRPFGKESNWLDLGAGNVWGFGILADHSLKAWGVLDPTNLNSKPVFRPIPFPKAQRWSRVAVGDEATAGIDLEGRLWTWGLNTFAGLGTPGSQTGTKVSEPVPGSRWRDVASVNYCFGALRVDGTVWIWGRFPGKNFGLIYTRPTLASPQTDWTEICTLLPLTLRNRAGELWQLPIPGDDAPWSRPQVVLTNTIAGRFALARGRIWEITEEGRLWVHPNPARHSSSREDFKPHDVGGRRDWVRLWSGAGSVVGATADGVVWVWGTDWFAEPSYPPVTQAELLVNKARKAVGSEPIPLTYGGTYRFLAEPTAAFRFVSSGGTNPPPRSFFWNPSSDP